MRSQVKSLSEKCPDEKKEGLGEMFKVTGVQHEAHLSLFHGTHHYLYIVKCPWLVSSSCALSPALSRCLSVVALSFQMFTELPLLTFD